MGVNVIQRDIEGDEDRRGSNGYDGGGHRKIPASAVAASCSVAPSGQKIKWRGGDHKEHLRIEGDQSDSSCLPVSPSSSMVRTSSTRKTCNPSLISPQGSFHRTATRRLIRRSSFAMFQWQSSPEPKGNPPDQLLPQTSKSTFHPSFLSRESAAHF